MRDRWPAPTRQMLWCSTRLALYLLILRLTTRSALRRRRSGSSSWPISVMADRNAWVTFLVLVPIPGADAAAGGVQAAGEADPVRVDAMVVGDFGHQGANGVVGAEEAVCLLAHTVRVSSSAETTRGPRWWVFSSSRVVSNSQRCG